jgi:hypothetical protein
MSSTYKDDLLQLEALSKNISDLIFINDFEKIIELDIERKKIIKKIIKNEDTSISKNKVIKMINDNTQLIEKVDEKMTALSSNHNKFSRRFQFYSLSK